MSRKAKAVVFRELNGPVSIEEVEVLEPKRNEVTIRVAACGVCHSDLSATNGTLPVPPDTVLGHEAAGTIVAIGPDVSDLAVGDSVAVSWIPMCGTCAYCVMGRPALCDRPLKHGPKLPDGTSRIVDKSGKPLNHFMSSAVMAEYATLHRNSVVPIPASVPLDCAALVGCAVTTGVGAVLNTARVEPGATVAVIGAGGVGLNAIQGAALSGARNVIAVDISAEKLEFAKTFGATHCVNASGEPGAVEQVKGIVKGGVDYAFECIGTGETALQSFQMVRKGGMAVVVGIAPFKQKVEIPAFLLPVSEKILTGSMYGSTRPLVDFPKFFGLYREGKLKLSELITRRYSIDDAQRAFDDMKSNARGVIVFDAPA